MGKISSNLVALVMAGSTGLGLMGCDRTRDYEERTTSATLHEDARVVQTIYAPSRHGTGSDVSPGITTSGDISFTFVDVKVDLPEKYAVVFQCQHGKFIVEGTDKKYKNLQEKLNENDIVDVTYTEQYVDTIRHQKDTKKGDDRVIVRRLVGYDFLDAQKKGKVEEK